MDERLIIQLLEELSRLYLDRQVSGPAYARLAESIIALSGLEEIRPDLEAFAELLASYTPLGGDGLVSDAELRSKVRALLGGFPM